ncbi:hypothetical protein DRP05_00730 [Archaeoglobales archaeon]|nr:MAG: hypothetical protein DRP05_00730 [Archaeoglobales archaeon]
MSVHQKICSAKTILKQYANYNKKYVFFSGGKDSIVCLDLANQILEDFKIIYIHITGNTHPKCDKFVEKVADEYNKELITLKSQYDFFDILQKYGYPGILWKGSRWCLNRFKDRVIKEYEKTNPIYVSIAGIKAFDSRRRMILSKQKGVRISKKHGWGLIQLYPIWNWTHNDVYAYLEENSLPLNELYRKINSAGNCVFCPAMRKKTFMLIKCYCPEFFCKWIRAHRNLRKDYQNGCLRGLRTVFHKFDRLYDLYCKNKTLEV